MYALRYICVCIYIYIYRETEAYEGMNKFQNNYLDSIHVWVQDIVYSVDRYAISFTSCFAEAMLYY